MTRREREGRRKEGEKGEGWGGRTWRMSVSVTAAARRAGTAEARAARESEATAVVEDHLSQVGGGRREKMDGLGKRWQVLISFCG